MLVVVASDVHDIEELRVSVSTSEVVDEVWEGVRARKPENVVTVAWPSESSLPGVGIVQAERGRDLGLRGQGSRSG